MIVSIKSLTLDDTNKANTISALASVLPVIEVKSTDALIQLQFLILQPALCKQMPSNSQWNSFC